MTSAASAVKLIQTHHLRVFTTADFATLSKLAASAATHALRRLPRNNLTVQIKRGIWVNAIAQNINPFEAVPYLRFPWPAYVSLYSALADFGVVSEIPQVIYAVSSATPKRYRTPIGSFHIHHLPEHLIWGYEVRRAGHETYPLADPEKAFLDLVYLALIPRSPIQLPHKRGKTWNLNIAKLKKYAARFDFKPLTEYVRRIL